MLAPADLGNCYFTNIDSRRIIPYLNLLAVALLIVEEVGSPCCTSVTNNTFISLLQIEKFRDTQNIFFHAEKGFLASC